MMKNATLAALVALFAIGACGGKKAPDTTKTTQPETKPAGSGSDMAGSAAPDAACKAAGGTCINVTAAVACGKKVEASCPQNEYCCAMH